MNEELEFYCYVLRAEVIWEISIWSSKFLKISRRKEWSFMWKCSFGSSLNNSGMSFQILASTPKKALFWISNLDFLIENLFADEDRVFIRMNTYYRWPIRDGFVDFL